MGGKPFPIFTDNYTEKIISLREIQKLFRILESTELIFYPINTCSGFAIGFQISELNRSIYPGIPDEKTPVLTFAEKQLPKGYNFKTLSGYFMKPENIEHAKLVDIEISDNHAKYEY